MSGDDCNSKEALPTRHMPPARARVRTAIVSEPNKSAVDGEVAGYEVGYGRPPKAHRFQPGRSGNPKGRPRGSRSIPSILSDELDKPISANLGGRTVTMTRRQALARRLIEKALAGDLRALALLLKLDGAGATTDEAASPASPDLSPAETTLLSNYLAKLTPEEA